MKANASLLAQSSRGTKLRIVGSSCPSTLLTLCRVKISAEGTTIITSTATHTQSAVHPALQRNLSALSCDDSTSLSSGPRFFPKGTTVAATVRAGMSSYSDSTWSCQEDCLHRFTTRNSVRKACPGRKGPGHGREAKLARRRAAESQRKPRLLPEADMRALQQPAALGANLGKAQHSTRNRVPSTHLVGRTAAAKELPQEVSMTSRVAAAQSSFAGSVSLLRRQRAAGRRISAATQLTVMADAAAAPVRAHCSSSGAKHVCQDSFRQLRRQLTDPRPDPVQAAEVESVLGVRVIPIESEPGKNIMRVEYKIKWKDGAPDSWYAPPY